MNQEPINPSRPETTAAPPAAAEARFHRRVALFSVLLILLLALGGVAYLRTRQAEARNAAHEQLGAIADLKQRQISQWREERLSDARFFSRARFAAEDVQRFLADSGTAAHRATVLNWLALLKSEDRYSAALIFDARGECRLAIPEPSSAAVARAARVIASDVFRNPDVVMTDLYHDPEHGLILLDVLFPIYPEANPDAGPPLAVVLLCLDARRFLFPLVQSWPTPSESAETLLIRQEGEQAVFLNDLRHRPGTALILRLPLAALNLPAAKVLQGETQTFLGQDYRGVPVVAVGRQIPGTSWMMVAKVDRQELYAPLRQQLLITALLLGGLLLCGTLMLALLWRHRRTHFLQRELALQQERVILAERLAESMRNAKHEWELTFDSVPDLIAIMDLQQHLVRVNRAMADRLGLAPEQCVGRSCFECVHGLPGLPEACPHALSLLDRQPHTVEQHEERLGGDFLVTTTPLFDSRNEMIGFVHVARDITEHKRTETARRDSEKELRRTLEMNQAVMTNMGEGLYVLDTQFRVTYLNPAAERLFGWSNADLMGRTIHDLVHYRHPDGRDFPAAECAALQVLQTGHAVTGQEDVFIRKDGTFFPVVYSASTIKAESGIMGLVVVFRDVTAKQQAEEALRQNEARLRTTFENVALGIVELDDQDRIILANRRFSQLLGYEPAELPGKSIYELTAPEDLARSHEVIGQVREGRLPTGDYEKRYYTCDGTPVWVHVTVSPLRDAQGRFLRTINTVEEISGRKQAEEEIRRLAATLEQRVKERTAELTAANAELEAFAYSVSHDLRAPLRHVIGFLNLFQRTIQGNLEPKAQEYLHDIEQEGNRMAVLIDDLLAFSRIGRAEMNSARVDLRQLLDEALTELKPDIADRRIEWRIGALPEVYGDRILLRQVLVNLLDNALKFTRTRDLAVIDVGTVAAADPTVYVRDNGVGFDPAGAGKLFGVFQRLHPQSQFKGTGVGLANVQRIIQRHGGRVWAESVEGQGATFLFSLPQSPGIKTVAGAPGV